MSTLIFNFPKVANKESSSLFAETIAKKDSIDSVRNAMYIFKVHKKLFTLPKNLNEAFAEKRCYDAAMMFNEAKTKFLNTNFKSAKFSFEKSLDIVNTNLAIIDNELAQFPKPFEEQKQMIM